MQRLKCDKSWKTERPMRVHACGLTLFLLKFHHSLNFRNISVSVYVHCTSHIPVSIRPLHKPPSEDTSPMASDARAADATACTFFRLSWPKQLPPSKALSRRNGTQSDHKAVDDGCQRHSRLSAAAPSVGSNSLYFLWALAISSRVGSNLKVIT